MQAFDRDGLEVGFMGLAIFGCASGYAIASAVLWYLNTDCIGLFILVTMAGLIAALVAPTLEINIRSGGWQLGKRGEILMFAAVLCATAALICWMVVANPSREIAALSITMIKAVCIGAFFVGSFTALGAVEGVFYWKLLVACGAEQPPQSDPATGEGGTDPA